MAYYVRHFTTGQPPTLAEIETGAMAIDGAFGLASVQPGPRASADVLYDGNVVAEIEINTPADSLFAEEIAEQADEARGGRGKRKAVLDGLQAATSIVAVRVLSSDDFRKALDQIDPVWEWLEANHKGVLQFDAHGFYIESKHVLRTD